MATKKISREANPSDLAQMKDIFGGATVKPVQQDTQVTQNEQIRQNQQIQQNNNQQINQIQTVAATEKENSEVTAASSTSSIGSVITEENKPVSDTTVGIRMTTAKKREMKAYFIQHGTTMSQGVLDSFALLKTLEAEGLIEYKDGLLKRK
ncbi:MAG: hypothetical protein MJ188_07835 [Treponema sp.]|nr:hypothetical protein [Treponema sp.]